MKQIYVSVFTSSLTKLVNKVAKVVEVNVEHAMSEVAHQVAKDNNLDPSCLLIQYHLSYDDMTPACGLKMPVKLLSEDEITALKWWNNLSINEKVDLEFIYKSPCRHITDSIGLTTKEILHIWNMETNKDYKLDKIIEDLSYEEKISLLEKIAQSILPKGETKKIKVNSIQYLPETKLRLLTTIYNKLLIPYEIEHNF